MSKQYNISFIGSGNLAWHLAPALENAGHLIREIYSRKKQNAEKLSSRLYDAQAKADLDFSGSISTIFFICVSDEAIDEIVDEIVVPENVFVCHTSGTTSIRVLKKFEAYGVFYPVQTFSKSRKINWENIPVCIEGDSATSEKIMTGLAGNISRSVTVLESSQRKVLHLAAVFSCNFTNHLLGISYELLKKQNIAPPLLHELIAETINKSLENDPFKVQTGPASRGDGDVIEEHLEMLETTPLYRKIYKAVTKSIIKNRNEK